MFIKFPSRYSEEFKRVRNEVNSTVRSDKSAYYRAILESCGNDAKETWKLVGGIIGKGETSCLMKELIIDNKKITDSKQIANGLNNYFSNIGSSLGEKFIFNDEFRNYLAKNITTTFRFNCVTKDNVSKIVKSLKSTSSPGYDGIHISVIKDNLDSLLDAIVYICNLSLQTGVFPQKLMIAVSQILENYRPKGTNHFSSKNKSQIHVTDIKQKNMYRKNKMQ